MLGAKVGKFPEIKKPSRRKKSTEGPKFVKITNHQAIL